MLIRSQKSAVVPGALLLLASLLLTPPVSAQERDTAHTVVTVGEMCGGCVKKITKRFESVDAVAKVQCSIQEKSITLIPAPGIHLSPKGVWEIMEGIGKAPKKLVGPDGTYTSKPKT